MRIGTNLPTSPAMLTLKHQRKNSRVQSYLT